MELLVVKEKELRPINGFLMLTVVIAGIIAATALVAFSIVNLSSERFLSGGLMMAAGYIGWAIFGLLSAGLKIVRPNEARVFTLFGVYYGTVKTAGYHYVNPFCVSFSPAYSDAKSETKAEEIQIKTSLGLSKAPKTVSLKKQTLDNGRQKVNDILGNPIIIGAVVVWYVENPTQAVFSVENYREFLSIQTDSIMRNVSRLYPYDVLSDDEDDTIIQEKTLRSSSIEIAEMMEVELQKRVESAGLVIEEVRITHLAYAEEIAMAMLQRQQATAIIAARKKIVDGAVSMVKMAIDKLSECDVVQLDEERKAAMVSNLLVILCSNRDAQPIVNSGSIY